MSKLSIVIPVYNGAPYVEGCLKCLDSQTFQDWEAIFVNDGSKDNTAEVLDRLVAPCKRCTVIHKANGGTAHTRNAGMDVATGKYITFMDVDDELEPTMYEKLVHAMESTGVDMAVCGYYFKLESASDGETTYLEEKRYSACVLRGRDAIRERLVDMWDRDILHNVWNKMYRMDLIHEKGMRYRDGHVYSEDRVFNRQYIENCDSMAVIDECLYYYVRERTGSTTEKFREDYFDIRQKEYVEQKAHLKAMDVWDDVAREYVSREFIERIAGTIENIFHADDQLTAKEKRQRIKAVITHPDVREALQYAECRSRKMRLLVAPIRMENVLFTYTLYKTVYEIRRKNPVLFHKLKSHR